MIETSDIGKVQQGGGVNTPSTGTYGEKADVNRLKSALPQAEAQPAAPAGPPLPPFSSTPVRPSTAAPGSATVPPGVPAALVAPTQRPAEPVFTPAAPLATGAVSADQRRIQVLSLLAENPNVSDATREWAQLALRALLS